MGLSYTRAALGFAACQSKKAHVSEIYFKRTTIIYIFFSLSSPIHLLPAPTGRGKPRGAGRGGGALILLFKKNANKLNGVLFFSYICIIFKRKKSLTLKIN